MRKHAANKGFAPLIILLIIAVIGILVATAYFTINKFASPISNQQQIKNTQKPPASNSPKSFFYVKKDAKGSYLILYDSNKQKSIPILDFSAGNIAANNIAIAPDKSFALIAFADRITRVNANNTATEVVDLNKVLNADHIESSSITISSDGTKIAYYVSWDTSKSTHRNSSSSQVRIFDLTNKTQTVAVNDQITIRDSSPLAWITENGHEGLIIKNGDNQNFDGLQLYDMAENKLKKITLQDPYGNLVRSLDAEEECMNITTPNPAGGIDSVINCIKKVSYRPLGISTDGNYFLFWRWFDTQPQTSKLEISLTELSLLNNRSGNLALMSHNATACGNSISDMYSRLIWSYNSKEVLCKKTTTPGFGSELGKPVASQYTQNTEYFSVNIANGNKTPKNSFETTLTIPDEIKKAMESYKGGDPGGQFLYAMDYLQNAPLAPNALGWLSNNKILFSERKSVTGKEVDLFIDEPSKGIKIDSGEEFSFIKSY